MNESRRKEQLKAVTGSLYPRREKFRGSCWPRKSAQEPLLGAPGAGVGAAPLISAFTAELCGVEGAFPERG